MHEEPDWKKCGEENPAFTPQKKLADDPTEPEFDGVLWGDDFYRCVKKYTAAQPEEDAENFIHTKYGYCYWAMQPNKIPIIFNLYTEPKFRRKGHAREHLQYIIKEIRNTGYAGNIEIEGPSFYDGVRSQWIAGFYKSMGLAVIKGTHK